MVMKRKYFSSNHRHFCFIWFFYKGFSLEQSPEFVEYVGQRLSAILNGAAINIPDPSATRLELHLNSRDGNTFFRPINVGFG